MADAVAPITADQARTLVRETQDEFLVREISYPLLLPPELEPWYVYRRDRGHCLMCVLAQDYRTERTLTELARAMIPVPVRTVWRKYEIRAGWLVVDLPSSAQLVLLPPAGDTEF